MYDGGLSAIVQEELGLIEILLLAGGQIEPCQCHLGNLVSGHHTGLPRVRSHLADDTVGIALGNVEELARARGLPVGHGTLDHVAQVVQLMREVFLLHPALVASPVVRVGRVLCAGGVEIAVRLLGGGNDVDNAVYIMGQLLVGIGLQDVTCTLDGLVGVGIVERVAHAIHLEHLRRVFQVGGSVLKVLVTSLTLAFREGQRDGHIAAGLQPLPPERLLGYLDLSKRNRRDGVALLRGCACHEKRRNEQYTAQY